MSAKIKSHTTSHRHKPKGVSKRSFEKVYWPYIPVFAMVVALAAVSAQNGLLRTMISHPASRVLAYASSISANDLLNDTNQDRQAGGDKPLSLNTELARAAQAKAVDMANRDYWSHDTPDGNPPWVFVQAQDYQYQKLGENLATGFSDSLATINGWMASPEHRANMLDPSFSQVGFGWANVPNYKAVGGGPMTIVVAFYGEPETASVPVTGANLLSSGSPNLPVKTVDTSRAQLALARTPLVNYADLVALGGGLLVLGIWIGRHLFSLRRALIQGETYVASHPLMDLGLVLIVLALFTLSRTAGLVQ
ncbi:MAG TPA: CAP domain-containing protein [Candidatus Saccharimonadales bacterium]|nr:CAP domain-containing protein [Candidatus Saccharimonadales bacterium]